MNVKWTKWKTEDDPVRFVLHLLNTFLFKYNKNVQRSLAESFKKETNFGLSVYTALHGWNMKRK